LVGLRPEVVVAAATQATHPSTSSNVTSISVSINTNTRGSFLSSSSNSSTVKATSREEISTSVRTIRQLTFLPSNQPEQSSSSSASRRPRLLLLWGTKPLDEALSKEGNSVAAGSQYPSKTRSTTASTRKLWSSLQP
jgi:hypothetical protein